MLSLIAVAAPLFVASEAGARAAADQRRTRPSAWTHRRATAATVLLVAPRPVLQPAAATYVVRPGDSLWSIAETQLGDGGDWPAIAALNLGRTMPDGLRFMDPGLIQAGWTLNLPGETVCRRSAPLPHRRHRTGRTTADASTGCGRRSPSAQSAMTRPVPPRSPWLPGSQSLGGAGRAELARALGLGHRRPGVRRLGAPVPAHADVAADRR